MEGLDIDAAAQLLRWCHGRRVTVYAYGVPTDTRKGLRWPERVGEPGAIHLNGTCISSSPVIGCARKVLHFDGTGCSMRSCSNTDAWYLCGGPEPRAGTSGRA